MVLDYLHYNYLQCPITYLILQITNVLPVIDSIMYHNIRNISPRQKYFLRNSQKSIQSLKLLVNHLIVTIGRIHFQNKVNNYFTINFFSIQ